MLASLSLVPYLAPGLWPGRIFVWQQPVSAEDAQMAPDDLIRKVLSEARVIALVGASPNAARPSHGVARFLQTQGYRVIPVNPGLAGTTLHGETVYPDLASIPVEVDMIDIFRTADAVPGIVAQALARFPALKSIWMQLGVSHPAAAAQAQARGVDVVQNHCPAIEIPRLFGTAPLHD